MVYGKESCLKGSFPFHRQLYFPCLLTEVCFAVLLTGTVLKLDDLRGLEILLQPVSAYWISIADQLGMASQVPIIQSTPTPPTFMRDLLHRWLIREHPSPTLEALCQALRGDAEIIGGAGVARKLEEMFQGRRGLR